MIIITTIGEKVQIWKISAPNINVETVPNVYLHYLNAAGHSGNPGILFLHIIFLTTITANEYLKFIVNWKTIDVHSLTLEEIQIDLNSEFLQNVNNITSNRSFAIGTVFLFLILVLTMFYFDPNLKTFRRNNIEKVVQHRHLAAENSDILESSQFVGYESILQDNFSFNINGSDVMVFLHIQKTGMFGK